MASTQNTDVSALEAAFCAERGFAIAQYAYYEESLACLFAYLLGVPPALAGIPFFKMNNSRARIASLERLLKKKHGDTYNLFWNSLVKQLNSFDNQRNNIVHWTSVITHNAPPVISLVPPNYWDADENTPSVLYEDLREFSAKCEFYTWTLSCFLGTLRDEPLVPQAWREIFLRPVTYPPPADHPRHRTPGKPSPQQPPSRA